MRRIVQLILLALFVYLIASTKWPPSNFALVDAFLAIDPLLSIQAAIASRTWVPVLGYGLVLLGLTLLLGRFFCGWMCPMGTCLEFGDDLVFGKKPRRLRKNHERVLRNLKYGILIVILVAAVFGQGLAFLFDPISWITRIFAYGIWPILETFYATLLIFGRPLFEAFGWYGLARELPPTSVMPTLGLVSLIFFAFLIWLGRYQRRFWCRSICPLGAMLAIPARFSLFHRKVGSACDNDGKCARTCETGAIDKGRFRKYDPGECIQCGRCVSDCHLNVTSFAPTWSFEQRTPSTDLGRRQVVGALTVGTVGAVLMTNHAGRKVLGDNTLRPPGALIEDDFLATCVRCGQCIKACPTHCLQPAMLQSGLTGIMTPVAQMRIGPCDNNCNACGTVCPTDAIRELNLDEKPYAKIGNAIITPGRCVVWEQSRKCLVCDEHCPYGAIYWREVDGGDRRPFVDENKCNGCGQCEAACPVEGEAAIRVHPNGQIRLNSGSYLEEAKVRGLNLREKSDGYGAEGFDPQEQGQGESPQDDPYGLNAYQNNSSDTFE